MTTLRRYFTRVDIGHPERRVQRLDLRVLAENAVGTVTVTDLQCQEGARVSGHLPATREMLRKLREDGLPAAPKHYNALVRGRQTIIVPNRGRYWSVALGTPVVTTAIDFEVLAKTAVPAGMRFSHWHRTRQFAYDHALAAGDSFEFLASQRQVAHNGVPTRDYTGFFHQCPAGNSRFNVDLVAEGVTLRPQPSVRLVAQLQEWELAGGGRRL